MRTGTVSYKVDDLRKSIIIPIGFVGENDFTRVIFDAEEIYKNYPAAQVSMKVQPPKGGIYPATVTRDGNSVIWQVKAADVAHRGSGELQMTFTEGDTVIKTYIARTDIKRSLAGNGPAPDPVQDWLDEAQEALEDIESAEVHQPIIGNDGYWYRWDAETGEYVTTGTKAQGQDGHSPVLTSSKSGKTTTLYADGEQIAQIQDGEDGQGADVIDDTAGEGDTDKTWSADKLAEETGQLLNAIDGQGDDIDDIKDVLNIQPPGTVNLFNVNDPHTTNLVPKTDGSGQITTSNGVYSVLLQVEPNSTVTLTKTDGNRCQILSFNSEPAKNDYWVQNVMSPAGNVGLTVTINVGATDVYLLCYLATSTSSCDYNSLKIFYGTEWHDSTPNKIQVLDAKLFNMLPDTNVFNLVSKRYLGSLTKPYIAISCDDGAADLATTTIPLFKGYKTTYNKNVPLTMGLMDTSAVLGNASQTELVNEMLEDYGCEIATHGGSSYTSYTDADLIDFLDDQQDFIYGKCGRNPVGIIYPNHAYDLHKSVISGSYYGVCAAGYSNGVKYQQANGERSNMYELHRWSLFVSSQTENTIKTVVDYAYEHNLLLMPWFHDNALTGDNGAANIALLDYLVSYGQSLGIDFISFKDIPNLI